mmetsp:Transcript_6309/g.9155  ORF Transcript_6309/g.9155 Transcript_6309/m.9155 type:complete len:159 (+) Transcript_6309:132-608(+)
MSGKRIAVEPTEWAIMGGYVWICLLYLSLFTSRAWCDPCQNSQHHTKGVRVQSRSQKMKCKETQELHWQIQVSFLSMRSAGATGSRCRKRRSNKSSAEKLNINGRAWLDSGLICAQQKSRNALLGPETKGTVERGNEEHQSGSVKSTGHSGSQMKIIQ